jgi:hypothetical protein
MRVDGSPPQCCLEFSGSSPDWDVLIGTDIGLSEALLAITGGSRANPRRPGWTERDHRFTRLRRTVKHSGERRR